MILIVSHTLVRFAYVMFLLMSLFMHLQDGKAYTYLLNVLAPEHCNPATLDMKDPTERAKLVLDHAERMDCKRYLSPKDIVEGSANLNLAFVAQVFHQRLDWKTLIFPMKLSYSVIICNFRSSLLSISVFIWLETFGEYFIYFGFFRCY